MNEQHLSNQHSVRRTRNKFRCWHRRPRQQRQETKSLSVAAALRDQRRLCKRHKAAGKWERRVRKVYFQHCEEPKLRTLASSQSYCKKRGAQPREIAAESEINGK